MREGAGIPERVRRIVTRVLGDYDVTVYLFGSHARGDAHPHSDVDVAVESTDPLPPGVLARLREALEESTIPCRVDVVDLRDASPQLRDRVLGEGQRWNVSASA